jgi:hypothetical protein
MEKDKVIFEFSRTLKETEKVLDNTKKLNLAKEEVIIKLKDEIKDLKFKLKNSENMQRFREDELHKYKSHTEGKFIMVTKEKENLEDKLLELTKLFENNQKDYQTTLIEYKKVEKQLMKLKQNFADKNESIQINERTIEGLKAENKLIPSLKKQISDNENYIKELLQEISNEEKKVIKAQKDKDDLETKFKEFINEDRLEKDNLNKFVKTKYELDTLKKNYEEKLKELEASNEKYKNLNKDSDNLVLVISNELAQFTNSFNNLNINKNLNTKIQESACSNFSNNKIFSSYFLLKYELVNKNFEILKNKIIEYYNNSLVTITKLDKSKSDFERSYREISLDKDNLLKENSQIKSKNKDILERNQELEKEVQKTSEDNKNLKQSYVKIKTENEDILKRNDNIINEIQHFLRTIFDKLKEKFPNMSQNEKSVQDYQCFYSYGENFSSESGRNFAEIILQYLDILLKDYSKVLSNEKDYLENLKLNKVQLKNHEDEKEILKTRIERLIANQNEESKQAELIKNEELKRQREVLYEKISSVKLNYLYKLTNLLEESNTMISLYENENCELKEKVSKLEYNLKMLTDSHIELE